jgi:hypothetical protein
VLQRRVLPLALAVTLLLAVVAIAARGRPLGSSGGHGGLPPAFWDYTYSTIVIVAVPFLLAVLGAAFLFPREGKRRRSAWHGLLRSLLLFTLLVIFEVLVLRRLNLSHLHLHRPAPQQTGTGAFGPGHNRRPAPGTRAVRFRWDELAVVLGLLLVVGAIIAARLSRPDRRRPLETAPEALAAALDESLDDLRSDPDLRRAIVAAYARMEIALAAAGIPRRPAEAPLEYLERALLTLDASAAAVRRLTDLFEWARFSQHEPEPSMRDEAVDALVAVRDELRASEPVPA